MVLNRIFENKKAGFYVDVGAHHPMRFSNTYFFYRRGWRGINIDAMPGSMGVFNEDRPSDINLEIPVSDKDEVLTYYIFNEPALNGFSKELSDSRNGLRQYKIIDTKELRTRTLASILDEFMPVGQKIDFLSIDVEGLDFQVLNSNNWEKYKPEVVLVEVLGSTLGQIMDSEAVAYMQKNGYIVFAKTFNTVFFKRA
jgi:FkbM family methyltransferase